ncbi:hypothetical protein J5N97_024864 [Dioscorea zingiberensis]|uniref:CN hydrolase domain-containing protein n=1 Tax=Dioscorea zingiberensis TaxID=325984 RepID=A0A9D5C8P9_9LILI|nr:hypothetical protein J5N97_024864 [Dioscorea zingiberensis]
MPFFLLPLLASALEFGSTTAPALTALLKLGSWLSAYEFNFKVFAHVATGFSDSSAFLQELTLKSMLVLAPKLFVATCSPARDASAGYTAWGHSTLVGPFGEVIATTEHEEAFIIEEIDYSEGPIYLLRSNGVRSQPNGRCPKVKCSLNVHSTTNPQIMPVEVFIGHLKCFKCDPVALEDAQCKHVMVTLEEVIKRSLDPVAAKLSRDGLAKTIYSRLFDCNASNG